MIDTVLFDMGGTLEDICITEERKQKAASEVLRILASHGFPLSIDIPAAFMILDQGWKRYDAYRAATNRELKPEEIWGNYVLTGLGLDFDSVYSFAEELAEMWELTYFQRVLRPHVQELLKDLSASGLKLGIVSNTASLFQVFHSLKVYGIRNYFSDVTLSSVTGYRKPHGNIFRVSLNQHQSDPSTCMYVGDTISRDIIGAHKAGFSKTVQICSQITEWKDSGVSTEIKPDYQVRDIYEVYDIIQSLNQ